MTPTSTARGQIDTVYVTKQVTAYDVLRVIEQQKQRWLIQLLGRYKLASAAELPGLQREEKAVTEQYEALLREIKILYNS